MNWRPLCNEFACLPETLSLPLGVFAAGHFQLAVTTDVHVLGAAGVDSTISYPTQVAFDVAQVCEPAPVGCLHTPLPST